VRKPNLPLSKREQFEQNRRRIISILVFLIVITTLSLFVLFGGLGKKANPQPTDKGRTVRGNDTNDWVGRKASNAVQQIVPASKQQ